MSYFPMFIELKDKCCLVVGGGAVAYRKVKVLKEVIGSSTRNYARNSSTSGSCMSRERNGDVRSEGTGIGSDGDR